MSGRRIDQKIVELLKKGGIDIARRTVAKYRENMAAVTTSDAAQAAKRFPTSAGAKIVVLGKAAELRPQLEGLGTVKLGKLKDYE